MVKWIQPKSVATGIRVIFTGIKSSVPTSKLYFRLKDRNAAGEILSEIVKDRLKRERSFSGSETVVVAIPRGGALIGAILSCKLRSELKVIPVAKIGEPENKEFAVGALTEDYSYVNNEQTEKLQISAKYIKNEILESREELRRVNNLYYGNLNLGNNYDNKTVVLVDDGAVTGATILAAARSIGRRNPRQLIIALPVCPKNTLHCLMKEADDIIVILIPRHTSLLTVGQHYQNFLPVSHREAVQIIKARKESSNE